MAAFDPISFGPVFGDLLAEDQVMPLGPGSPNQALRTKLEALTPQAAFAHTSLTDPAMAHACIAAVWLYHDFLDESHRISQELHSTTGSYWHGILHRREPDYSNAKYWFRRVGRHPIFPDLAREANALAASQNLPASAAFLRDSAWDPMAFIDLCAGAAGAQSEFAPLCRQIQQREWQLLFDFCYQAATTSN